MNSPFEVICAFREGTSVIDALDQSFNDYLNDPDPTGLCKPWLIRQYYKLNTVLDFDYTLGGVQRWHSFSIT